MGDFWQDYIRKWSERGGSPSRLVCMADDAEEFERICEAAGECGIPAMPVDDGSWMMRPFDKTVVVGTHDGLLSRALNRGYGMPSNKWPIAFGLLNNDSRWVMKEADPVWDGLSCLHGKLGAFNMEDVAQGGSKIPIKQLFCTSRQSSFADIRQYMHGKPPDIPEAPKRAVGTEWVMLSDHSSATASVMERYCSSVDTGQGQSLLKAARYHDWGKAHKAFQDAFLAKLDPEQYASRSGTVWAKRRPRTSLDISGYYHDLAAGSAMAHGADTVPEMLESWLVLTHHGRFREDVPDASGSLPGTDLGDGIFTDNIDFEVKSYRWREIHDTLYDCFGPFRLGYMEALLRVADMRASDP